MSADHEAGAMIAPIDLHGGAARFVSSVLILPSTGTIRLGMTSHQSQSKEHSGARQNDRTETIAKLNDDVRKGGNGQLVVTQGVLKLPGFSVLVLVRALAAYDTFNCDNDPYNERDFGAMEAFGARLYWKIDYYDLKLEFGSPDPSDPNVTCRVLTVMLESEY